MTGTLSKVSDDLAQVVKEASPVVVRVEARRRLPASGVVWSEDGVIVTAHHAVERDENIEVGLPDGKTLPAKLAGRDPRTDVAVLRVDATDLATPTWAGPEDLRVGHLVLALGRPGQSVMATLGIISVLGQDWRTPAGGSLDRYVQTDVVMYPGFSGGPLVDSRGGVLGFNTTGLARGVAMAVAPPTLGQVVDTLLTHGRVRRGYLGIGAQPVRLPESLAQQLGQETGLLLASVESDSPAEKSGLLLGDIIVSVDGRETRDLADLLALLSAEQIGKELPARVVRGGVVQELTVVIGDRT